MSEDVFRYVVETFAPEDARLLERMARRAVRAGMPLIMISEDQAPVLRFLVRAIGARRVLDVGTLFGYSAAVLARAMGPRGRVVSLESDPRHAGVARENLVALGLSGRVRILEGPALGTMRDLPKDSFDLVLIDADKGGYPAYLQEAVRVLRDGGIVAADNALAWGKAAEKDLAASAPDASDVAAIRRFNQALASRKDVTAALLPVGDGLAVGLVTKRRRVTTA